MAHEAWLSPKASSAQRAASSTHSKSRPYLPEWSCDPVPLLEALRSPSDADAPAHCEPGTSTLPQVTYAACAVVGMMARAVAPHDAIATEARARRNRSEE